MLPAREHGGFTSGMPDMTNGQVRSPNEARVYGTGESIEIEIVFDQDVILEGDPVLLLETGVFDQQVMGFRPAELLFPADE